VVTFSEVIKLQHDNLTMHRLVKLQPRAFLVSAVCYGEWTAEERAMIPFGFEAG